MQKRKRGTKNPEVMPVDIGKLLNDKIKELRISKTEVARKINRPPSAIHPLLGRPSMQCYLLWELSIALEHDFFADLSAALREKNPGLKIIDTVTPDRIAALQQQMDEMKKIMGLVK